MSIFTTISEVFEKLSNPCQAEITTAIKLIMRSLIGLDGKEEYYYLTLLTMFTLSALTKKTNNPQQWGIEMKKNISLLVAQREEELENQHKRKEK
jgi:hypothetical protein